MKYDKLPRGLFLHMIAISLILVSGCGKNGVTNKPGEKLVEAQPPAVEAKETNPLVASIRDARLERSEDADQQFMLKATLTLANKGGQEATYEFRSEKIKNHDTYMGIKYSAKLCANSDCSAFADEATKAPISARFRCTNEDCTSSLAIFEGEKESPYKDWSAMIERQVLSGLKFPFVSSSVIGLNNKKLREYEKILSYNFSANYQGVVELVRVPGTTIQNLIVYIEAKPTWSHSVFYQKQPPVSSQTDSQLSPGRLSTIYAPIG